MKGLIINNSSGAPALLKEFFADTDVCKFDDIKGLKIDTYDFAVLSGSSDFPVTGNEEKLQHELSFIHSGAIPILGICYGFELIVAAFGGTLKMLTHKSRGLLEIPITKPDRFLEGVSKLFVYEGHRWVADIIPDELVVLAQSPHGIEAVKHKELPIYGVQFHPEKLQRETAGGQILKNFLHIVEDQKNIRRNVQT